MFFFKKKSSFIAGSLALLIGVSAITNTINFNKSVEVSASVTSGMRDMSSVEVVKDMGVGWNLGNTFDACGLWISGNTPSAYETAWGNPVVTQDLIKKVKSYGYKTIRIPITWAQNISSDNKINAAWMARIKEVVDWCMQEDLYVIINIHHDGGNGDIDWIRAASTNYTTMINRYVSLWEQVSKQFENYSDYLVFESMNEVEFKDLAKSDAYNLLNKINQTFVDTVRNQGGNNSKRHLLIAGYNTDIVQTCDSRYKMPTDPANKCILSIHYYTPSPFAVATVDTTWCVPRTTWGTKEDLDELNSYMMKLYTTFISKGTPVIIGEYGVLTEAKNQKELSSIEKYLANVSETALSYGMCPVLWDSGSGGDMQTINRSTLEYYNPSIKTVFDTVIDKYNKGLIESPINNIPQNDEVTVKLKTGNVIDISPYAGKKIIGLRFGISCSTNFDSYGGGAVHYNDNTGEWNFAEFGFNSVYDTVEVKFSETVMKNMIYNTLDMYFWWTALDDPNDDNSGHQNELSFKNNEVTIIFESSTPVVTTAVTTTSKPIETTTVTTTSKPIETTTVTTTSKPIETTTVTTTSKPIETTTSSSALQIVYGDLNGDKKVDNADLVSLSQHLIGDKLLTENNLLSADLTADTVVDIADLALLKQYIMGDNVKLGPTK